MKYILFLTTILLLSCKKNENLKNSIEVIEETKSVTEILGTLNKKDTITFLDLSNKKIDSLPDLSEYIIIKLDLSNNNLDSISAEKLPKGIKTLIATNNQIKSFKSLNYEGFLMKYKNSNLNLEEIDLSFNKLENISIAVSDAKLHGKACNLKKVNVSNNNLNTISFGGDLKYLDISNNPKIMPDVFFEVEKIDTLIQNNNPYKIKTKRIPKPGPIICYFN